jgi:hypothetical protein
VNTNTYSLPAPAVAVRSCAQVSMWAVPEQGIRLPFPVTRVHGPALASYLTCTAMADAAQGATKGALGDEAFEDPV